MVHLFYSLYNFRLSCFFKVYEYFKLQTNIDTNYIINALIFRFLSLTYSCRRCSTVKFVGKYIYINIIAA